MQLAKCVLQQLMVGE